MMATRMHGLTTSWMGIRVSIATKRTLLVLSTHGLQQLCGDGKVVEGRAKLALPLFGCPQNLQHLRNTKSANKQPAMTRECQGK